MLGETYPMIDYGKGVYLYVPGMSEGKELAQKAKKVIVLMKIVLIV
jgi:hypothetical protein